MPLLLLGLVAFAWWAWNTTKEEAGEQLDLPDGTGGDVGDDMPDDIDSDDAALLKEFARTGTGLPNIPPEDERPSVLENLRRTREVFYAWFADIASFSSAYRSDAVNSAVGGRADSYHRLGLALDLVPRRGHSMVDIFNQAQLAKEAGALQSIFPEKAGATSEPEDADHIHVQVPR